MRFVSTALVMMTISLMLLALTLLGPAKSDHLCSEPRCANKSPHKNSQTTGIEMPHIVATALPDRATLMEADCLSNSRLVRD
jgi:hypothetical protein